MGQPTRGRRPTIDIRSTALPSSRTDNPKLIVLTGATRGLGRAMALKFAALGHTIVGCGTSREAVAAFNRDLGKPHRVDLVDVTDDMAVAAWAQSVVDQFGAPDLLLNNAAVVNRNAVLWEVPADEFSRVVDVNIKGVANVIRHFVPAMIARETGVIVNFSSGWGRVTSPEVAPYCATKYAIEGLTQALAQELPSGLAAVPLNPGIIKTEMLQSCFGDSADHYPTPDVWAERAVPFLLELGPKHTGRSLDVP